MAHSRRFRFGITAHQAASGRQWRRLARNAESLGYSSLLVPDHFGDQLAPVPALAAAAEATSELRVGPLVICNDFKHPVVVAKELATIDVLSGGRVEWGMGAGWLPSDYKGSGISFDPPGVRVDRLREALAVLKGLFAPGSFSYSGTHYELEALDGRPEVVQRPHPPLLIGAGQRRMLSLAGREADIVGIAPSPTTRRFGNRAPRHTMAAATDQQVAWIRGSAGDRFADLELNMVAFPAIITDDPSSKVTHLAKSLNIDEDQVLESPHVWLGSVDQICETLHERRERWGVSYWVVPAAALEAVAPIVSVLAGA